MTNDILGFLNQFTDVSADDFEDMMSLVETVRYEKKVKLTEIGQVEKHMYFILNGLVRKYFLKGKNEIITHIVKEGGIAGSGASFLSGAPSVYIVETLEPTTAIRVNKEKMEHLYQSKKKWEKISRIMTIHYFLVLEHRMLDNIRFSIRERFIRFMKESPDLLQRVPQKHLASYLNIKPETFSRLKHLMLKEANNNTSN